MKSWPINILLSVTKALQKYLCNILSRPCTEDNLTIHELCVRILIDNYFSWMWLFLTISSLILLDFHFFFYYKLKIYLKNFIEFFFKGSLSENSYLISNVAKYMFLDRCRSFQRFYKCLLLLPFKPPNKNLFKKKP
jgi:hypothetical protein